MTHLLTRQVDRDVLQYAPTLSEAQIQMDGMLHGFSEGASDWRSLVAMTAGGLAYRATKLGVLSVGANHYLPLVTKLSAPIFGLASEVTIFRGVNQLCSSGQTQGSAPTWKSWFTDYINFASLKIFGLASRNTNLVLSHTLQDAGMVVGHQLAYGLNLTTRPEGTLFEQWVHAEITNLQMQAGLSLGGMLTGYRFAQLERSLEVRISSLFSPQNNALLRNRSIFPAVLSSVALSEATCPPRQKKRQERPPQRFFGNVEELRSHLREAIVSTQGRKLLEIELEYDDYDSKREEQVGKVFGFQNELHAQVRKEILSLLKTSDLQELRIYSPNGDSELYFRHLSGDRETSHVETFHISHDEHWDFHSFPREETLSLRLVGPWEIPTYRKKPTTFAEELVRLRRKSEMTQDQVAARLRSILASDHSAAMIGRHENGVEEAMPLATLKTLADIYRTDVRRLLALSNLARFPDLDPREWSLAEYPIYVEGHADLERLKYYQAHDPARQSLGFRVYAARKNPWHPLMGVELAERMGFANNLIIRLETNANYPALANLQALAPVLGLEENNLLLWANATFHPDLPLKKMFGERGVYLPPTSREREQILYYQANPGTLGEEMYVFRKIRPGHLSPEDMSAQIGKHPGHWRDREWNRVPVTLENMKEWISTFTEAGMPLDNLMRAFEVLGLHRDCPAYLLASAMGRLNRLQLHEATGVDRKTITQILLAESAEDLGKIQPQTILDLRRALPNFRADLFYRLVYPDIVRFFPEANGATPQLEISPDEIQTAASLNVGHRLYAYRMEHGVGLDKMAERLGVSDTIVKSYETLSCQIENPAVVMRLAEVLGVPAKILYLHYQPQILRFYPLKNPQDGKSFSFDDNDLMAWNRAKEGTRDTSNMRRNLALRLRARGIQNLEAFAEFIGLPKKKAEKFWYGIHNLTQKEIHFLHGKIPELDYQQWFEHFYGPELEYFLGRNPDGSYNYTLPPRRTWQSIDRLDLEPMILAAIQRVYASPQAAAEAIGVGFLGDRGNLKRSLRGRAWSNDNIARIARGLHLDARLLYFYFHYEDLSPFMR